MVICIVDIIFKKLFNFDIYVDVFVFKYIMYFFMVWICYRGNLFCCLCYCWFEIYIYILLYYIVMKSILVIYLEK